MHAGHEIQLLAAAQPQRSTASRTHGLPVTAYHRTDEAGVGGDGRVFGLDLGDKSMAMRASPDSAQDVAQKEPGHVENLSR